MPISMPLDHHYDPQSPRDVAVLGPSAPFGIQNHDAFEVFESALAVELLDERHLLFLGGPA